MTFFILEMKTEMSTYFLNIIKWMKFIQWKFQRKIIRLAQFYIAIKWNWCKECNWHSCVPTCEEPEREKCFNFPLLQLNTAIFTKWNQQLAFQFLFACFYDCCSPLLRQNEKVICWKFSFVRILFFIRSFVEWKKQLTVASFNVFFSSPTDVETGTKNKYV